ncbi:MAG: hypothetical protein OS130_00970 [Thermodesulfobacteriota bacterium]|jgi:hypothetical protein|nr:MAG: hypothetical protein OS130_00970 [Thermodesulfobacteriota bacterium]
MCESADLKRVNGVIARFCHDVVAEPLCFFSEADLQSMLFAKLSMEFPEQIETSCSRGPDSKGKYKAGLVHREYGAGGGRRIDISVFDPDDVARIDEVTLKTAGKYIKPRFAIELGTEKSLDATGQISRDLDKLADATERGYLIHFFRDTSRSAVGTGRRENKEQSIESKFRNPVNKAKVPQKVRSLFFLIRVARRQKKIWGKCEMYLPETGKWQKVNLQNVCSCVAERLR